jgi:colanic acid biosynthesis glycosyl transferase WcaI
MKILLVGLNYAPELTGVGKYSAEMAEALVADGHEVHVVCGPPYYPQWRIAAGFSAWRYRREVRNGVQLQRVPLWVPARPTGLSRLLHLASFALASLPALAAQLAWRPEVVMSIAPSLMSAPGAWLVARLAGAHSWLHIQDYEVDAAFDLGLVRGTHARRMALAIERRLLTRFDVVSSLSAKMVERAIAKGVDPLKTYCLPNWVDTRAIVPLAHARYYRKLLGLDKRALPQTVVLYAGNMGSKQGLEILAAAAAELAGRPDISFVFCGNGPARAMLEARCAGLANCSFMALQPARQLNQLLNLADIHVLPQRGGAADLVMPSKLNGMLASGRAIVAMACTGTELYEVVAPRGVVVPPENVDALVEAIEALAADPLRRAVLGAAGREYAERSLSSASVLGDLSRKLRELCGEDSAAVPSSGSTGATGTSDTSGTAGGLAREKLAGAPLEPTQVD